MLLLNPRCNNKVGYITRHKAHRALHVLVKRRKLDRKPQGDDPQARLTVYKCAQCNLYHLGHKGDM